MVWIVIIIKYNEVGKEIMFFLDGIIYISFVFFKVLCLFFLNIVNKVGINKE